MKNTPIAGIGASAGGLKEFEQFFKHMPDTKEVAFVIIQHLSPNHKSTLAEIVNRYTEMDVCQIEHNMTIKAGNVYIIPPNNLVSLKNDTLQLNKLSNKRGLNLPIDVFFRSLKDNSAERSVAVILSGTGTDGTLGIKEVKEAGGLTVVQQPDTADYDGMPTSAIRTGLIDYVIPVNEMPNVILNYIRNEFQEKRIIDQNEESYKKINQIFNLIRHQIGHDFANYKRNTIYRRIERRLAVNKLDNLEDYIELLKKESSEVVILYKELLISVTNFFRDKDTFRYIEKKIIPKVVSGNDRGQLKIWVPACATGEEAYTLALLYKNYIDDNKLNVQLKVFASDIDIDAIEKAREGYYPKNIEADVPEHLLERYFLKDKEGYKIKKSIREAVIFADQNLVQDPPYSGLDMISCRNLLIYLDNYLQHKAISIFHYALKSSGYLLLGNSESLGSSAQFYEVIDPKHKVFCKIDNTTIAPRIWNLNYDNQLTKAERRKTFKEPVSKIVRDYILEKYSPPGVVIDKQGMMLFAQGRTGKYLEITTGEMTNNITKIAKDELRIPLANVIRKAINANAEVVHNNIRIKTDSDYELIDIIVTPLKHNKQDTKLFVVLFKSVKAVKDQSVKAINERSGEEKSGDDATSVIYDLENELAQKEQYLQNTIEELETTNEELKSSNEEAQSTNEELQRTNEELETSKEELQSVNEELTTTNNELGIKFDELNKVNSYLKNLLSATDIATIFLDKELKVFNFTPAISIIIDLLQTDIGRSIKQFTYNLKYNQLVDDAKDVLETLIPKETEVENSDGRSFWMRIIPYRTIEDTIEGVVITFTEITEKKEAEIKLKESEEKYRTTFENAPDSIIIHDFEMNIIDVNQRAIKEFGYSKEEFLQKKMFDLHTKDEIKHSEEVLHEMKNQEKVNMKFKRKDGALFWADASPCRYELNGRPIIHVVVRNITELVETRNELIKSKKRLDNAEILAKTGNWEWDIANNRIYWSDGLFSIFKRNPEQGAPSWQEHPGIYLKEDFLKLENLVEKCRTTGDPYEVELRTIRSDGEIVYCISKGQAIKNEEGKVIRLFGTFQDITEQKETQEKLRLQEYLKKSQEIGLIGTWHLDLVKSVLTWTEENYKVFGVKQDTPLSYELFLECVHPEDRAFVEREFKKGTENNVYDIEHRIKTNGNEKWVREKAEIVKDKNGKAIEAIGVTQDITFKKKVENELKEKAGELAKLNKDKDSFISVLAHDLKNPLNGLIGFSELLLDSVEKYNVSDIKKHAGIINDAAHRINRLLHDTLMWANPRTNTLDTDPYHFNLNLVIENEIKLLLPLAMEKDIHIKNKIGDDVHIFMNPAILKTVVRNLVNNAIKFTPENGSIFVDAEMKADEIVFSVSDTGIGMAQEDIDKLFEIKHIRSTEGTNKEKGTGFGLRICDKLITSVGGGIHVKSTVGKGSTFYFTIPLLVKNSKENNAGSSVTERKSKATILIADDEEVNFELLKVLIEDRLGIPYRILYATDGKQAVDLCANNDVDLVIMDIKMPVMDGLEAAGKIKEIKPGILIAFQSANLESNSIGKAKVLGCDDFLPKPVEIKILDGILKKVTQKNEV